MQVAWQVASERIEGVVHLQWLEDVLGEVGTEVLTAFLLYDLSEKGVVDVRILRSLTGRTALLSRLARCLFDQDRKSTRLNSSHANISYAVFCLKKKNVYWAHIWLHFN